MVAAGIIGVRAPAGARILQKLINRTSATAGAAPECALAGSRPMGLEIVADGGELGVDLAGKAVQASDSNQGDQGRDQGVLDQILAGLIVQKVLQKLFHYPVLLNDPQCVRS
jgi:hypothetical protein